MCLSLLRYAFAGAIAGPLVELDVRTLYLKDLSLFGCTVLDAAVFPNLIKLIEAEKIFPVIANTFSLLQVPEAQKQFETKKHIGKFIINISSGG